MYLTYKQTKVYYEILGQDKNNCLLFLHGWGCCGNIMKPLSKGIIKHCSQKEPTQIYIDFPPFGESESPKMPWKLRDYAELVYQILQLNNINSTKIIAHSFGVRVAILLAEKYNNIAQMVFIGGAGLKMPKSLGVKFKILRYKLRKKLGLDVNNYGSADYKALPPIMKQTFNNIVSQNLAKNCKKLTQKVLLIYGENDNETPVKLAKRFNKLIKNSKLVVLKNAGHYVWVDDYFAVQNLINNFFKND